jgi:type IV pilus assembly protein PilA
MARLFKGGKMKAVRMLKTEKGFSLIELMIVVAIIGILATVAIPNFQKFQAKARQSETRTNLASLYTSMKGFHSEWNVYYGDFRDIGLEPNGRLNYNYGFAGAGTAPAAPFTGSTRGGGAAGVCFNTGVGTCGFVHQAQSGIPAYAAAAAGSCTAGANPTATTFTASSIGNIGTGTNDVWTITQNKVLCNNTPNSI